MQAALEMEDRAAAPEELEQAWRAALAAAGPEDGDRCRLGLARALRLLDREEEARSWAQQVVEGGTLAGEAHWVLAQLALDGGESVEAHGHLLAALEAFASAGNQRGLADAARAYGEHLAILGNQEEARAGLTLARKTYEALGDAERAGWVQEQLDALTGVPERRGCGGGCKTGGCGHGGCGKDAPPG